MDHAYKGSLLLLWIRGKRMKSLTILGRRWFQPTNGNTYFSASALIDGAPVSSIDRCYGYGSAYEWEMFCKLQREGLIADVEQYPHSSGESPWRWCERHKVTYHTDVVDVQRKKDL